MGRALLSRGDRRALRDCYRRRQQETGLIPRPEPRQIGPIVNEVTLLAHWGRLGAACQLERDWREAADDPRIINATKPLRISSRVLYVGVSNSSILQELRAFEAAEILRRWNEGAGTTPVREIRFKLLSNMRK